MSGDVEGPGGTVELEIRHLRYFVTLVEESSFTRAARRLGIAQSALSSQIQRVERHLGVSLVHRRGRRIEMTAAGEELAVRARSIMASVRAAELAVSAQTGSWRSLRAGCFRAAWWSHELSRAIEERMPTVRVAAETVDTIEAVRQVEEGRLDIAACYEFEALPVTVPKHLPSMDLLHEPVWVALPDGHPVAEAERVTLADLAGENWLMQPTGSYPRRAVEAICREAGFTPRPLATGDSWEIGGLISKGRGVTLCSPLVAHRDGIVTRPLDPVRWRRTFLVHRPETPAWIALDEVKGALQELYRRYMLQVPGYAHSPQDQPRMA